MTFANNAGGLFLLSMPSPPSLPSVYVPKFLLHLFFAHTALDSTPDRYAFATFSASVAMVNSLFSRLKEIRTHRRRPPLSFSSSPGLGRSVSNSVGDVPCRFDGSFSLGDLRAATRNFHPENLLGEGGFGPVYKGILDDGTVIAVKKLSARAKQGTREFINEVNLLSKVQHRNLVRLFGCCAEGDERMLVYEYLRNKSLDLILFETHLDWPKRHGIVLGAAKALAYLHDGSRSRIIHRDIKASNILLDEKFQAKIADFGLAKLFDDGQTHATTRVAGSFGYMAPEYALSGKLTEKADIYSFGMVILEVVSGRRNMDDSLPEGEQRLVERAWRLYRNDRHIELVDHKLSDRYVPEEAARFIHVALLCTQAAADLRPCMSQVVTLLNGRSQILLKPTEPPLIYSESFVQQPLHGWKNGFISETFGPSKTASISSFFSQ